MLNLIKSEVRENNKTKAEENKSAKHFPSAIRE